MNTKDLKNYINEVLGDSVRCLLPSFWWKRLFGMVVDKVDEVEQSTSKLIDSKVEEVKMPIVESVDELEKLNVEKGGLAAVEKVGEPVVVNLEDCYLSGDVATDWDKYTVIRRFSEKSVPSNAVGQISLFSDKSMENGLSIACSEGKYFYYKIANGGTYYSSLEEVNEYLASGKYRLVVGYFIENISAYVTLYSEIPTPSLYIKGDSWEKIAKESDILGSGSDNTDDSGEDVIAFLTFGETEEAKSFNANAYQQYINFRGECPKVVVNTMIGGGYANVVTSMGPISNASEHQYITLIWCDFGGKMHETLIYSDGSVSDVNMEESIEIIYHRVQSPDGTKAHNAKIYQKMNNSFVLLLFNDASRNGNEIFCGTYGCSYIKLEDYFLIEVKDSINPRVFKLTSDGTLTFERRENYFDSELSDTSEIAVKNKVIKAYVDSKVVELEARLSALENK